MCLLWTFHINGLIQYVVCWERLLSLSLMFARCTHVVARITTVLLFMAEYCSVVGIHHALFIHSSVDRYVGCFHFGA